MLNLSQYYPRRLVIVIAVVLVLAVIYFVFVKKGRNCSK
jgi:preprotein translocase subunit SecG